MRGYSEVRAISPAELRALYPLACMRVCTTVVMSTHSNPNPNLLPLPQHLILTPTARTPIDPNPQHLSLIPNPSPNPN